MIMCPYCQHENLEGTIFCTDCGASLAEQSVSAAADGLDHISVQAPDVDSEAMMPTTARISMAELRLLVLNSGRMISCPHQEVILIGRVDPASNVFPEVDLTQDNGYMAGVSRRHARIIRRGMDFFVEDLGSINGTFLNRNKVPPNTLVPFQDGAEIRLGNLVLRVILEDSL
jgi:pSer/pThr/pTyr-binding forkhead associated (FHA) protein